jgi:hypothetical protein
LEPDDASLVDGKMASPEMSAEVDSSVSIGARQRDTEKKIREQGSFVTFSNAGIAVTFSTMTPVYQTNTPRRPNDSMPTRSIRLEGWKLDTDIAEGCLGCPTTSPPATSTPAAASPHLLRQRVLGCPTTSPPATSFAAVDSSPLFKTHSIALRYRSSGKMFRKGLKK